jgi:hypothetical protein
VIRKVLLPILAAGSLALGGCAASIAAGVAGAAFRSAGGGKSAPAQDLAPAAAEACKANAAQQGEVNIIDVERRSEGKIVVWGTVENSGQRQSFECRYDGKIAGFKLRQIQPR